MSLESFYSCMKASNFRLRSLGMVNALGGDLVSIRDKLLLETSSGLTEQSGYLVEQSVPVGKVLAPLAEVPQELSRYQSRNAALILTAYQQIRTDVERLIAEHGPSRIGIVLGTSTSGIAEGEQAFEWLADHNSLPSGYRLSQQEPGSCSRLLAEYLGVTGVCYSVSTACSSSAKVFRSAKRLLELDLCDAVITGGADSLCKLTLRGFDALELVSRDHGNPFSVNRNGINIGEGAALFVMTPEPGGIQLLGVGESSDAYHISSPEPSGEGAERAIRAALEEAQVTPEEIDYLNLHGTGTTHNDAMESRVVSRVFGSEIPCSSTKPFVGHMLGAAGATEIGFCWLMLHQEQNGILKLAEHLWDGAPDPELPTLALTQKNQVLSTNKRITMLSNSFAFGGSNCSVIIGSQDFPSASQLGSHEASHVER